LTIFTDKLREYIINNIEFYKTDVEHFRHGNEGKHIKIFINKLQIINKHSIQYPHDSYSLNNIPISKDFYDEIVKYIDNIRNKAEIDKLIDSLLED